ncbi:selenocysteine-specific translation elongation factor [Pollutimonas harenae]|uniref:Selenocysteine-specific elongation factor n=1 Tax=Pollutimonas harenae TaxID=657015 RepID=A0A853H1K5_9BURK|nr:selenocysteine-specific translation elongation factor [Pollutimonas harenae]NYT85115.1 selenocysteine-specific translation elongation factor [Pollutimonas harenae]TEA72504.1 selenocysteine-specific translation elongation factor [Pollutimonas harenae]
MIVGTAGHIDHGKTTLVRALTGVDTDRLKEEKARGISIELGYAYTPLPNDDVLGFIDVPGHERLIHTMAAGASGIDFGLLVVAADDGIMPQTLEHLAILSILGISRGAIAITKADRVDEARLHDVQEAVVQLTKDTFLQNAAVFFVSATTDDDAGLHELRTHLHAMAQTVAARNAAGLFRLAVDRVFTLKGQGTVVTGTVHDGVLALDDDTLDIRLMPAGQKLRVRSIHAQNQASQEARAGQRCALNLGGIDKSAITRGDWIADARCFVPSRNIDVELSLLPDSSSAVRAWSPLHIHLGASHFLAHAVPLSCAALAAGETGWIQLVFDQAICAMPGDRYLVRDAQARHTIGGGVVLDPNAPQRKRRSPERLAWLQAVSNHHAGAGLPGLLQQAPWGLDEYHVLRLTRRNPDEKPLPAGTLWISARGGQSTRSLILQSHWNALISQTLQTIASFHKHWPDEPGIDAARLRRMAWPTLPEAMWLALSEHLTSTNQLARNGPWLHLPEHAVGLTAKEIELAGHLLPLLHAGRFDPPWVRDLAVQLNEDEQSVRQTLLKLLRRGDVYQVVRDLFYHREQIIQLAGLITAMGGNEGVNAAQFRDKTGLGRKRAIQILEFFDRAGYTRRLRDHHVLRKNGADFWHQLS